jgi:hypothetical protein
MADELQALNAQTMTGRPLDEVFRDQVRSWVESVRRHERRENQLVQDAFNVDFDAED